MSATLPESRSQPGEMGALIAELRDWLRPLPAVSRAIPRPVSSRPSASDSTVSTSMILESDTAAELGHPRTESAWCTLLTWQSAPSTDWRVTIVGPDAPALRVQDRRPLGVALILGFEPGFEADPIVVDRLPFLSLGVPGVMVRSVPGRTWIRLASTRGRCPSLLEVGAAWLEGCARRLGGLKQAELVFVTSSEQDVLALRPMAAQARLLAGEHRKLALTAGGDDVECFDASCGTCEDKPVCDGLRDILARRRRA